MVLVPGWSSIADVISLSDIDHVVVVVARLLLLARHVVLGTVMWGKKRRSHSDVEQIRFKGRRLGDQWSIL